MGFRSSRVLGLAILLIQGCSILFQGCSTGNEKKFENLNKSERARLLLEVANGALIEGDPTGALQNLVAAEKQDPDLPDLQHSMALAYFAKHDVQAAIRHAKRAVELKPEYSEASNTLGRLYIETGQFQEATEALNKAAHDSLYRDAYKAWTNLGIINYRLEKYTQAENMLDRAIQDAPATACIAYYYRGHVNLKKMQFNRAIQDYDQATRKLCAKFGDAYLALGVAYQQNRQFDLARKTFLDVQKRYPNSKLADRAMDQIKFLP